MIFDNLPSDLSDRQLEEFVIRKFRALRSAIFDIVPGECLLKPRNLLYSQMIDLIDIQMLEQKLIEGEDICAVCSEIRCPCFNIKDRADRAMKLKMLNTETGKN